VTSIPAELRARAQWVCWRLESRDGKPTKVPYQTNGRKAASNDPYTWTSYEEAAAAADRFDGIGYALSELDPYVGLDWDDCLQNGQLHPAVAAAVDRLATYAEWSPSGNGVHAFAAAVKQNGRCRTAATPWGGKFEVYDRERYLTVTGDKLPAAPKTIEPRQAELERVLEELLPDPDGARPDAGDQSARETAPRPVADLLEEFPRLRQIARREVAPPRDPSDSGWDHYISCEALRCGCSDPEIEELIGHARGHDAKSRRPDYLKSTIAAAHRSEPGLETDEDGSDLDAIGAGATASELGARITANWKLPPERKILVGQAIGSGDAAIIYLTLADGSKLRFPRLSEFFDPATHVRRVSIIARCRCPSLTKARAIEIAQQIIELCEVSTDLDEDLDELQGWLNEFVRSVKFMPGELRAPGEERWQAFLAMDEITSGYAGRVAGVIDGERFGWLPADPFMRHVRYVERAKVDWPGLISRMEELGWEHHRLGAREPKVLKEDAKRIRRSFFAGTDPEVRDDE
jgi:hypothetical protein